MNETVEILDRLVAFDTVSAKPNAGMVDYIDAFCRKHGAVCTRVASTTEGKVGLIARFGPDVPGGVVLSGHCDVVPVEGQVWSRPAFKLTRQDNRLFGRGTTDMKGFLACMLAAGKRASESALEKPLTLVFSYDEEVGCVGIQEMQPKLPDLLGEARLCVVGEPTEMNIATGHKGKAGLRAICVGESGHSALAPQFVNALHLATDFVAELRTLQEWYKVSGAHDAAYDVPFTTFHVGVLSGGTALNIVPDRADLTFEYRYLPADDGDAIREKIEKAAARVAASYRDRFVDADIQIENYSAYPGLDVALQSDAVSFATSLSETAQLTKVAFGTEAGVFTAIGVPTVVCGPGSMSGQGHKPDEFVELSQLVACDKMLAKAVESLRA